MTDSQFNGRKEYFAAAQMIASRMDAAKILRSGSRWHVRIVVFVALAAVAGCALMAIYGG